MAEAPPTWARPYHQALDRVAKVTLLAFADAPLDLSSPINRSRHGLPLGFDVNALDVRQHLRHEAPEWFDGFFTPAMLRVSEHDLPGLDREYSNLTALYSVRLEFPEPPDLAYLQGCWAFMAWLCECGARFVLDEHAIRWHTREQVLQLDPMRAFDIKNEISVVFETDLTPGFGHVMHTRGLAKFGRPDLVLRGAEQVDAHVGGILLNGLASRAALGAALLEKQTVGPKGLTPRPLIQYEPGRAHPEVHLNNDGLVLDIGGWGLRELP
jgi:hypothetical protein